MKLNNADGNQQHQFTLLPICVFFYQHSATELNTYLDVTRKIILNNLIKKRSKNCLQLLNFISVKTIDRMINVTFG